MGLHHISYTQRKKLHLNTQSHSHHSYSPLHLISTPFLHVPAGHHTRTLLPSSFLNIFHYCPDFCSCPFHCLEYFLPQIHMLNTTNFSRLSPNSTSVFHCCFLLLLAFSPYSTPAHIHTTLFPRLQTPYLVYLCFQLTGSEMKTLELLRSVWLSGISLTNLSKNLSIKFKSYRGVWRQWL